MFKGDDDEVVELKTYEEVPDVDDGFDDYEDTEDKPVRRVARPRDPRPFANTLIMRKEHEVGSPEAQAEKKRLREETEKLMKEYKTKGGVVKQYNSRGELITLDNNNQQLQHYINSRGELITLDNNNQQLQHYINMKESVNGKR